MESLQARLASININEIIIFLDVLMALAIILIFFLLRGIFARIILKFLYKIKKAEGDVRENEAYGALKVFFIFLGLYLAIRRLPMNSQVLRTSTDIFQIIAMLFIAKFITSAINPNSIIFKSVVTYSTSNTVNNFICRIIRGIVWIITFFVILYVNKINLNGLAAGLGIGSAVIALAAQDLVKSLLCGMAILTDKPFNIGDWIEVGKFAGTVTDITFRSTRIMSVSNSIINIPNSVIASEYVTNWNKLHTRRFDIILNLSLQTSSEKIMKIVKQIKVVLETHDKVVPNSVEVHFDEIASMSNNIKIFLYVKEKDYIKFLDIKQELLCELLKLIEKENIDLAYPTQTVYLKNTEEFQNN